MVGHAIPEITGRSTPPCTAARFFFDNGVQSAAFVMGSQVMGPGSVRCAGDGRFVLGESSSESAGAAN